jgi:transcriptional regulator with XRE-family HTH domain
VHVPESQAGEESPTAGVAARIKALRLELGLNQSEFARSLGVSRSHISEVETNNVKIPIDLIFSINKEFREKNMKSGIYWLLTGDDRSVPWGNEPELSPLNLVLGLDSRALSCTLDVFLKLSEQSSMPDSPHDRGRLFRQIMYAYISELERSRQAGTSVDEARHAAQINCRRLFLRTDDDVQQLPMIIGDS